MGGFLESRYSSLSQSICIIIPMASSVLDDGSPNEAVSCERRRKFSMQSENTDRKSCGS
jgi:hypothetical protein